MKRNNLRRVRGFTLIELLVVLVILGLLAGLVGPQVMKYLGGANTKTAKLQIEDFSTALDAFRLDMGRYPTSAEGLAALVVQPSGATRWNGPYLRKNVIPKDPWGNDYVYLSPGAHGDFDLMSYGADGVAGGEEYNKDVNNWDVDQ